MFPALRLLGGLTLLVTLGTLLLLLPGMARPRLSAGDALFTATSALSVTGLSVIVAGRDLTLLGQLLLLALVQVGGVGFMVVAAVLLRLLGRQVTLADRLALRDTLGLIDPGSILRLVKHLLLLSLAIEAAGALLLWLRWRLLLGDATALFYGIFHAVSAFCNAGWELFTGAGLPVDTLPGDGVTLAVMGALIVTGGLGFPVLEELVWPRRLPSGRRARLSLHSRVTLLLTAVLLLGGGLGILLAESQAGGTVAGLSLPRRLGLSTFQSASARTAGFAGLPDFENLTPATRWLTALLMFVGCPPASMGGGITTGTLAVVTLALWGYVRGNPATTAGKRAIPAEIVRRALAVLTIALLLVGICTWLILLTHGATLEEAFFEVVSAFATCGLTLDFTGRLNPFGRLIIMAMMFWGRLGALTVMVAVTRPRQPQLLTYPEEQLLVG